MSLLKDKWVWISVLIGAVLAVGLSMLFVETQAATGPSAPSGTLKVNTDNGNPAYGKRVYFDTETANIKKTYFTYVTLVCWPPTGANPTYVQVSVAVAPNAKDQVSIELRDYFTGPGGFPWHWNGEPAECGARLSARSDNARGRDGYDMPTLDEIRFNIPYTGYTDVYP